MALWLVGCDPSHKTFVVQASPNPMVDRNTFVAEPLNLEVTQLEDKAKFRFFEQPKRRCLTVREKETMRREFMSSLVELGRREQLVISPASKSASAPFVIHSVVMRIDLGCSPTLKSRVAINTDAGLPVDEFEMEAPLPCSVFPPAPDAVLGRLATAQAEHTVKYLARRRLER
jgi:hypothetical protein